MYTKQLFKVQAASLMEELEYSVAENSTKQKIKIE
jgi:hypothetical protein